MSTHDRSDDELEAGADLLRRLTGHGLASSREREIWTRVQRGIEPVASTRRRFVPMALGGGAAAVVVAATVVALLWWARPAPPPPALTPAPAVASTGRLLITVFREGDVELSQLLSGPVGGNPKQMPLPVEAHGADRARFDFVLAGRARVATWDRFELVAASDNLVVLRSGTAAFDLDNLAPGQQLVIRVAHDEVIVHGTRFIISAEQNQLLGVSVEQGVVEVRRSEGGSASVVTLRSGETLGEPATPSSTSAEEAFARPWWRDQAMKSETTGYLAVTSDPTDARVHIDGVPLGRSPLFVRWPHGVHALEVFSSGRRAETVAVDVEVGRVAQQHVRLARLQVDGPTAPPRGTTFEALKQRARALLQRLDCDAIDDLMADLRAATDDLRKEAEAEMVAAECRLRRQEKARALASYQKIVRLFANTDSAETALFESATLLDEMGQSEAALVAAQTYLASYSDGTFVEPATFRRCELLVRLERLDVARTCFEVYRARFPRAARINEAVLYQATIAAARARWREGADFYRDYLRRAPHSPRAEEALYGLFTALHAGNLGGARGTAADYVRRFPHGRYAAELAPFAESSP